MSVKEKFYLRNARALIIQFNNGIIPEEDWIKDNQEYISEKIEEACEEWGYEVPLTIQDAVDIRAGEVEGNTFIEFVFINDYSEICEGVRDYKINSGEYISFNQDVCDRINKMDTYGSRDITTDSAMEVVEVFINDAKGIIEYYLRFYILSDSPYVVDFEDNLKVE